MDVMRQPLLLMFCFRSRTPPLELSLALSLAVGHHQCNFQSKDISYCRTPAS